MWLHCGSLFTVSRALYLRSMASLSPHLVRVRVPEGDDNLSLALKDCWGLNREYQLVRDKNEHLSKTLDRIVLKTNYMKHGSTKASRKRKRKNPHCEEEPSESAIPIEAHLYMPTGELVKVDTPNICAWEEGNVLVVGSVRYDVHVNIPTILSVKMPSFLLSGCPIVPEVTFEFTDFHLCQWEWFRCPPDLSASDSNPSPSHLQIVGTSRSYWTSDEDCGCKLLLRCTPRSEKGKSGDPITTLSVGVTKSPEDMPITRRHLLTPARLGAAGAFRVVSYNTLASVFTSTEHAQNQLYPYCDPTALSIDYRQARIAYELLGYNADILGLQEVGTETYNNYLLPALKDKGYNGCHVEKSGTISEGEAIFYDTSRFTLVAQDMATLGEFLQTDPSCAELHTGLASAPSFLKEVATKSSIVAVVLLRSVDRPDHHLLVSNTHLYYHPKGDHVRLVQAAVLVNFLRTRIDKFASSLGANARLATVLCGDFNSCPCIAAYTYLVSGFVERDHEDWEGYKLKGTPPQCVCYQKYNYDVMMSRAAKAVAAGYDDCPEREQDSTDSFRGLALRHEFHFENVTGVEHCTNFTSSFKAVLDYIMIDSDQLVADRVVPLPPVSELSQFTALPSVYFPSDHVALVADIKWK